MMCDFKRESSRVTEDSFAQTDENKVLKYTNMGLELISGTSFGSGTFFVRICNCEVSARDTCGGKCERVSKTWYPFKVKEWNYDINMDSNFISDVIPHLANRRRISKWRKEYSEKRCKKLCLEMVKNANKSNPCKKPCD